MLGEPKTRAGSRIVPIDRGTATVLGRRKMQQDEERRVAGKAWVDTGLVFTNQEGEMIRPHHVSATFQRLVRLAGVPRIRLHDLRHTHASLALAAGVELKVVSDRLGHSTTSITSDLYTHVIPAVARAAAEQIAASIPTLEETLPSASLAQEAPQRPARDPPEDETAGQGPFR